MSRQETMVVTVPMTRDERSRLDAICGRGRAQKKGAWVREAILERLDAWERGTAVKAVPRKPA